MFFYLSSVVSAQNNNLPIFVQNLPNATAQFFDCESDHWKIIAEGKAAIPLLIDKLDDATLTSATNRCKEGKLTVSDLAYLTLNQLMPVPLYEVTQRQFDVIDTNGCVSGVLEYIATDRNRFKAQVKAYYEKNKTRLKLRLFDPEFITPCRKAHGIKGYYVSGQ